MVPPGAVIKPSLTTTKPEDWTAASIQELITHIISAHHERSRQLLRQASLLAGRLRIDPEVHRFDGLDWKLNTFSAELRSHLDLEETTLFPACIALDRERLTRVRSVDPAALHLAIHGLTAGHEAAREGLIQLIRMSHAIPGPASASLSALRMVLGELSADLHEHERMEQDILLPAVIFLQELSISMHTARPFSHDHTPEPDDAASNE